MTYQLRVTGNGQTDQTQGSDSDEHTHTYGDQETDLPSNLNSLELMRPNPRAFNPNAYFSLDWPQRERVEFFL